MGIRESQRRCKVTKFIKQTQILPYFFTLISFGRRSRRARGIAGRGRGAAPRGVNLQSVSAVQGFQEGRSERLTTAFLAAHLAQVSPHAAFFGFVYKVVSHGPDYRARCWIMGAFPVSLIFHTMASPCSFFDVARRPCHKPEEAASGRSHAARCGQKKDGKTIYKIASRVHAYMCVHTNSLYGSILKMLIRKPLGINA